MNLRLALPLAVLLTCAAVSTASADALVLKDGTRLEGRVIEQRPEDVVFEHKVGGATVRSTFRKADLRALEQSFGAPAPAPAPEPPTPPVGPAGAPLVGPKTTARAPGASTATEGPYTEARDLKTVAIVVDRSSSMAIAERFSVAIDEVEKIVERLPETARFHVYLFDTKVLPIQDGQPLPPTKATREKLRGWIDAVGVNFEGFTDVVAGLAPAIERRPDAIYLISDGVPTAGARDVNELAKGLDRAFLRPSAKRLPIHTVCVIGGKYELLPDIEDQAAARLSLKTISISTGGKHRDVDPVERRRPPPTAFRPRVEQEEGVTFHYFDPKRDRELFWKESAHPRFDLEIRDESLLRARAVIEYTTDLRVDLRTYTCRGALYDELKGLPVKYHKGTFFAVKTIDVVRTSDPRRHGRSLDASPPDLQLIKVPVEGGSLEVTYHRGGKEVKDTLFVKCPAAVFNPQ